MELNKGETLWYSKPASQWIEALPLGNGRIGAMVYGGALAETIQVDESTFWSGEPSENNVRVGSKELVDQLRALLLEDRYEQADTLARDLKGYKNNYGTSMPVANLTLKMCGVDWSKADYLQRGLDLSTGVARTQFQYNGAAFCREAFVSHPAGVFALRFSSDNNLCFDMEIRYDGICSNVHISGADGLDYLVSGDAHETLHSDGKTGVRLYGRIRIMTNGVCQHEDGTIQIIGAESIVLLMALETTMFSVSPNARCKATLDHAQHQGYEALRSAHIEDHRSLYRRMEFNLHGQEVVLPTDERIKRYADGGEDPGLIGLTFQYGRYLLIAASREDSPLPTHMGGIWNDNIYNNSDCTQDMHIDMNVEMQYWLANACNLPECSWPLFRWIRDVIVPSGRRTARETYEAGGWAAHIVSNPWGYTALGWSYNWGVWALGGVWIATLIWDYYQYTKDKGFLRDFAYPILKGAARFALDYSFPDPATGCYMSGPSYSPENMFSQDGKDYFLSLSTTCDIIMMREIFTIVLDAAHDLGLPDDDELMLMRERLPKLPDYQIGRHGQIQEWYRDFEEPLPGHRHTSHLLGLYPFSQIIPERDVELAKAARVSIERRYEDFEITSWGMVMFMSYYARLFDGDRAESLLRDTFRVLVRPNLASVMSGLDSMWHGTWEMDGNTGLTSAICEMLVQSHDGVIRILPALPTSWKNGEIKGVCLRGGLSADICWKDGMLDQAVLYARYHDTYTIKYKERIAVCELGAGQHGIFDKSLNFILA